MKHKSDVFGIFKKWKAQVENQTGKKTIYLRIDNGLEYRNKEFIRFCELEQNGVVERMKRTLAESVKCMGLNVGLPKVFWAKTVNTASFIINKSPSLAMDFKIPEEIQSSRPVDYSSLKIFGCLAYVHVLSGKHSKLDSKSRK